MSETPRLEQTSAGPECDVDHECHLRGRPASTRVAITLAGGACAVPGGARARPGDQSDRVARVPLCIAWFPVARGAARRVARHGTARQGISPGDPRTLRAVVAPLLARAAEVRSPGRSSDGSRTEAGLQVHGLRIHHARGRARPGTTLAVGRRHGELGRVLFGSWNSSRPSSRRCMCSRGRGARVACRLAR